MSKRRQDGNLRDVTESDNCVPDFTSARFFAARISFLFGTRIGIRHAAAFFTRLICKLFHGWERKTAPPTFIAGRARWQCRTLCTHRGANEENAVLEAMDIGMPELNGLEAARQIRKGLPNTEIVILSLHLSDELVYEIVQAGVRGYVLKSDANRDLVNAVEALSLHRTFFTAKVSEMMLDGFCNRKPRAGENGTVRDRLTGRQREIVQLLAEGKSSKEVAVALNISVKTAETHRANIMRKLELHSVSELVRYAVKNQIIEV